MNRNRFDVAVVGAGILGLSHAYAAARQGLSVIVFERLPKANGASVRNFGMIWPIGQPAGVMHQLALRSRLLWLDLLEAGRVAYKPSGSLHVMYRDDEAQVAREFAESAPSLGYDCCWLDAASTLSRTRAISSQGLIGALWSPTELTVDPRAVLAWMPRYLEERYNVQFRFACAVSAIDLPRVHAGSNVFFADSVIVCGGDDFATLYPDSFQSSGITRCKLQMLRTVGQPDHWQLGPSLAGGLTLQHYGAFKICTTLEALKQRIAAETPELNRWGIHILASQTSLGEITIGDSHEYGIDVDIFDKLEIDRLIQDHAERFLCIPDFSIAQRWHGVYAKHPDKPFISLSPADRVRVVTATGGAGMTLSFGLAEQTAREMGL
jgi:FAD dependent oxidoreductase TIGR03364